jgi:hypothetical protein
MRVAFIAEKAEESGELAGLRLCGGLSTHKTIISTNQK